MTAERGKSAFQPPFSFSVNLQETPGQKTGLQQQKRINNNNILNMTQNVSVGP
jgi:hypothetical protein